MLNQQLKSFQKRLLIYSYFCHFIKTVSILFPIFCKDCVKAESNSFLLFPVISPLNNKKSLGIPSSLFLKCDGESAAFPELTLYGNCSTEGLNRFFDNRQTKSCPSLLTSSTLIDTIKAVKNLIQVLL